MLIADALEPQACALGSRAAITEPHLELVSSEHHIHQQLTAASAV